MLAVPLKAGDRVIGVLSLGDVAGRTYTEDELALLAAFVGQGAVALENSALYREIRDARDFLQSITENSPDAIITTDREGRVTYFSRGAEAMFGCRADEMIGTSVVDMYPGGLEEARSVKRRVDQDGLLRNYESGFLARDGRRVEISASISVLRDASGAAVGTLGLLKDIAERRQLEEQLRQSQKMDAIGRLAGGIAHDFNNLLTVIAGRAQMILARLRPEEHDPPRRHARAHHRGPRRRAHPAAPGLQPQAGAAAAGARPERGDDRHGAHAEPAHRRGHRAGGGAGARAWTA